VAQVAREQTGNFNREHYRTDSAGDSAAEVSVSSGPSPGGASGGFVMFGFGGGAGS